MTNLTRTIPTLRRPSKTFIASVVVPTLVAAVYYGAIASDVYISESRFVVRSPQRSSQSTLGALLQGTGFARSQDDTYSVHDFILSRDALRELDEKLKVRAAYTQPAIDFVNRFPGLDWDDSFEAFHRYYQHHVGVAYDSTSSISVLRVRAYTAEDAQRINDLLLQMGERLVNNLNLRSRRDLIEVAESEVRIAERKAKEAAAALSAFRGDRRLFDPNQQSALQLQGVARLQQELIAAEAQLAELRRISPDNPQVGNLQSRVDGLRRATSVEESKVAGRAGSLTTQSPEYDRLALEKGFADRQLAAALAALDTARSEAARKQLYLERLVQPNLPDYPVEPRRIRSVFTVLVVGLAVWGVLSLLIAGVREHAD